MNIKPILRGHYMPNQLGFKTSHEEKMYIGLLEKMVQYISYKLIAVIKQAEEAGLDVVTGEMLGQSIDTTHKLEKS